jgi:hypothetical protein
MASQWNARSESVASMLASSRSHQRVSCRRKRADQVVRSIADEFEIACLAQAILGRVQIVAEGAWQPRPEFFHRGQGGRTGHTLHSWISSFNSGESPTSNGEHARNS